MEESKKEYTDGHPSFFPGLLCHDTKQIEYSRHLKNGKREPERKKSSALSFFLLEDRD